MGAKPIDYTSDAADGLRVVSCIGVHLADPAGGGLHAELVLIRLGNETWSAVGSLDGGDVSHELIRESVLMTGVPSVFCRLGELSVFAPSTGLTLGTFFATCVPGAPC